jgi:CheY-like chemotaxis protein
MSITPVAAADVLSEPQPGSRSGKGAQSLWEHMASDKQRTAGPTPSILAPPSRAEFRVLVVDDSPAARYATARILRVAGFKTVEAAGGAEALRLAIEACAVVLDLNLPDVHGLEVCRLIRSTESTKHLPIIHVSAVDLEPEHGIASKDAGADAFIPNPVGAPDLVAELDRLLTERRLWVCHAGLPVEPMS